MNETPQLRLQLRILGEPVVIEAPQPPERVRLDEVLPLLRDIDDRAVALAVTRTEIEGKSVSCCKGCSACCRAQPVPITPPEAYALARYVEQQPEPRRTELLARFADRVERLHVAGLADGFLQRSGTLTLEQARAAAERYFRLGLVCPFLEDDACSIYEVRPFVCRQYLVTSPAELCRDPFHNPIDVIPMPLAAATAVLNTTTDLIGVPQYIVPLTLALEYVAGHRAELERTYPSRVVFTKAVQALAQPEA